MLIDTHVLIDLLGNRGRIGVHTRDLLREDPVFVSVASPWEMAIKAAKGHLAMPPNLSSAITEAGVRPLPILVEHALAIGEITGLPHADPFDRLLLTQAKVEGLDFYTWDRAILAAGLPFVRDARA
ncbi:MAG TPA: type II toxin-antitoxin system VapC family toxin [Phycicoccus sp.]|jgi:PIN domain nuclease of toxin-antitoxin system|nr:type II toxin-antitoxin system VapC family toxin [Phycicoccus sp.]